MNDLLSWCGHSRLAASRPRTHTSQSSARPETSFQKDRFGYTGERQGWGDLHAASRPRLCRPFRRYELWLTAEYRLSLRARRNDHTDSTRYQLQRNGRRADRFTIGLDGLLLPDGFDGDALAHCQRA